MNVRMIIKSTSESGQVTQKVEAKLYQRDGRIFYHYEEPQSEMGRVVSILRVEPELIRLLRQGDIQSEQQFQTGKRLPGYYSTPHGRMELDAHTNRMDIQLTEGLGSVSWSYDLYVAGERTGTHLLEVRVAPLNV